MKFHLFYFISMIHMFIFNIKCSGREEHVFLIIWFLNFAKLPLIANIYSYIQVNSKQDIKILGHGNYSFFFERVINNIRELFWILKRINGELLFHIVWKLISIVHYWKSNKFGCLYLLETRMYVSERDLIGLFYNSEISGSVLHA